MTVILFFLRMMMKDCGGERVNFDPKMMKHAMRLKK